MQGRVYPENELASQLIGFVSKEGKGLAGIEYSMEDTHAESMMLIAAEAKTGEVLSYISLPSANLNDFSSASKTELKTMKRADAEALVVSFQKI